MDIPFRASQSRPASFDDADYFQQYLDVNMPKMYISTQLEKFNMATYRRQIEMPAALVHHVNAVPDSIWCDKLIFGTSGNNKTRMFTVTRCLTSLFSCSRLGERGSIKKDAVMHPCRYLQSPPSHFGPSGKDSLVGQKDTPEGPADLERTCSGPRIAYLGLP